MRWHTYSRAFAQELPPQRNLSFWLHLADLPFRLARLVKTSSTYLDAILPGFCTIVFLYLEWGQIFSVLPILLSSHQRRLRKRAFSFLLGICGRVKTADSYFVLAFPPLDQNFWTFVLPPTSQACMPAKRAATAPASCMSHSTRRSMCTGRCSLSGWSLPIC